MTDARTPAVHNGDALSVDALKLTINSQVEIHGIAAEIRTYDWSASENIVAASDHICFTRVLVSDHLPQPVQWKVPGSKRFITVGPVGIIPANTTVVVRRQPDNKVRSLTLRVEPETFYRITGLDSGWYDEKLMLRLNKEGFAIVRLLGEIADELTLPGHASDALIEALATAFLVRFSRMVRNGEKSGSGLSTWQLNRVRELVDSRPANQLDIGVLARACGISGRHLMRGFKAATGMTAHQYIQQVRVERTKRLLSATRMPLEAIAAEVGFANASHLSNTFLKQLGIPPSVFRQQTNRS